MRRLKETGPPPRLDQLSYIGFPAVATSPEDASCFSVVPHTRFIHRSLLPRRTLTVSFFNLLLFYR